MGQGFLIDTNVIIDYTSNRFDDKASAFVANIFDTDFNISVVVKIEVLGYGTNETAKMQLLEEFIDTANILSLDDAVTKRVIALRRIKKIKLGDAIIAATALEHDLTLISRNVADFVNIQGLTVINPWD